MHRFLNKWRLTAMAAILACVTLAPLDAWAQRGGGRGGGGGGGGGGRSVGGGGGRSGGSAGVSRGSGNWNRGGATVNRGGNNGNRGNVGNWNRGGNNWNRSGSNWNRGGYAGGYNRGNYGYRGNYGRSGFYTGLGVGYGLGALGGYGYGRGYGYGGYGYNNYGYGYNNYATPVYSYPTDGYYADAGAAYDQSGNLPGSPPDGEIFLTMPADADGTVAYQLNDFPYTIRGGQQQKVLSDRPWVVQFDRGDGRGSARYTLSPGRYKFTNTDKGWELVRTSDVTTALN